MTGQPQIRVGPEQVTARCFVCTASWAGTGRKRAQRALDRAQDHANRTGHLIDVQHKNRP